MRKETYLSELKAILDTLNMSEEEKASILKDYANRIDKALKEDDTEAMDTLFNDRDLLKKRLESKHPKKKPSTPTEAINGIMPFVTLIIFVLLGVFFDAWHPGWMVFLMIPLTAIVLEVFSAESMNKVYALVPVTSLIVYLVLGLFYDLWHPGWLVLTLGIMGVILLNRALTPLQKLTACAPFVALVVFIMIGFLTGVYVPTWTVFLLILFTGILNEGRTPHKWLLEGLLLVSLALYLFVGVWFQAWTLALFSFLVFIIPAIFTGHIHVKIHGFSTRVEKATLLLSIVVFFLWGVFFDAWAVAWVVFFAVPSMSVILHAKGRDSLVPITVFISILIFYLIGYYTQQWHVAWLVFLGIPIVAIVQET